MPVEFTEMIPNSTRQAHNVISVNFQHLSQWIYTQFDWSNSTGHKFLVKLGVNSWGLHLYVCLVEFGGLNLNGFTPNSTGHEILVKMGVNSLRLHLYACLIKLGIIPVISTQFEGGIKFYPPQSNSTGHEILVKMGVNSLRLHLYAWLIELGIIPVISTQFEGGDQILSPPVEFDRA